MTGQRRKTAASWGRYPLTAFDTIAPRSRHEDIRFDGARSYLPHGKGRSYGDVCLNEGGVLIETAALDRFISFDAATGEIACEAGVTLGDIMEVALPRGWFLPVTPGTKFVTVGGAIANDVHGKNHHREGTFGRHVKSFELARSDGSRLLCSPGENSD